jgi:hypothetical protein
LAKIKKEREGEREEFYPEVALWPLLGWRIP